jgi:hypothetical protein
MVVPSRLDLDRGCDLYLDHLKVERNLAANTIDGYSRDLARLRRFLDARGRAAVDQVSDADLTDYLLDLADALSARSRARAVVAIRGTSSATRPRPWTAPALAAACPMCWARKRWSGSWPRRPRTRRAACVTPP